jgi:hypothetical protein
MSKEGLVQEYYDLLFSDDEDTKDPGRLIYDFYRVMFERKWNTKDLILFRKAVKLFGRSLVFFSVLKLTRQDEEKINHSNIYRFIHYLCTEELKGNKVDYRDLSEYSDRMEELKKRKLSVQDTYKND